ncbi:MAG TPA: heavy-metal-associated domain-containing protein [Pseudomonadales bacterium]|nr:heavy-metal-associated domain-containing protein [Pseudomonadales bacterium]
MIKFTVKGMTCGHCAMTIKKALHKIDAAAQVQVDIAEKTVYVQSEHAETDVLAQAISEAGYEAQVIK